MMRDIARKLDLLASNTKRIDGLTPLPQRIGLAAELAEEQDSILEQRDIPLVDSAGPSDTGLQEGGYVKHVQNSLQRGQAILRFLVFEDVTEAMFLDKDTLVHYTVRVSSESLSTMLKSVCYESDPTDISAHVVNPILGRFDATSSYEAYRALMGTIESLLRRTRILLVYPDRQLRNLAFEALVTQAREGLRLGPDTRPSFLIDQLEVQYGLGASYRSCGSSVHRRENGEVRVLTAGLDCPQTFTLADAVQYSSGLVPNSVEYPYSESLTREVSAILQAQMGDVRPVSSASIAESTLADLPDRYTTVHIVAHFEIDAENPYLSSLVWAPSMHAKSSGESSAYRMAWLDLNGCMVFLSGCNTVRALGDTYERPLVNAFVSSGSTRIIGCLWNLDEEVSWRLANEFYARIAQGKTPSSALREAKLALMRSGFVEPFYWAGLVLLCDSFDNDSGSTVESHAVSNALIFPILLLVALLVYLQSCIPWMRLSSTQHQ